jgi:NAD-dependent SIR2 family protein deacetylase
VHTLKQDYLTLAAFLRRHPRLVVLTGAGVSAESGIPTYRDSEGTWLHRDPIQQREFLEDEATRRRYWARSWFGWPVIRDALPNAAHFALARMEKKGMVNLLITQNVDRLHQRAGSQRVVDLHGRVDRVRCLSCTRVHRRETIQTVLQAENRWTYKGQSQSRPDGDMDIPDEICRKLVLPRCHLCAGDLMPDVVFFGGNVPRTRVASCLDAVEGADALLAVGSSLKVFSGFRFCRSAVKLGKPLVIINPGVTRADDLAALKLRSPAGPLLARTAELLC